MVEVFSTNVDRRKQADFLRKALQQEFPDYDIHFDLEDCDNILRIECTTAPVHVSGVTIRLAAYGFTAQVLPDEPVFQCASESLPDPADLY